MTQTVPRDRWEHAAAGIVDQTPGPPSRPRLMSQTVTDNADAQNVVLEQVDLMIFAPPRAVSFTIPRKSYLTQD